MTGDRAAWWGLESRGAGKMARRLDVRVHVPARGAALAGRAARVDALLATVPPRHAPIPVAALDIVDVRADQRAKTITWSPVAQVPLG